MISFLRTLASTSVKFWMKFVHAVGWFNTRLILTVFYILLVIPAIIFRLIRGKRYRQIAERDSFWTDKESTSATLDQARHQF